MAMAFGAASDREALALAQKILTQDPESKRATAVVNELKRRAAQKTFGRKPSDKAPSDIAAWAKPGKIPKLIAMLDEVCAEQHGFPGGVDLADDWRVKTLIRIGEPAVPALIDVIEHDDRLTRSVHSWRMGIGCTILGVREAALTAVMSILKVRVFEAGFTGDNFTGRGPEAAKQAVEKLRAYWDRFGKFSFDERMMEIIRDPAITGEQLREAVESLAFTDDEVRYGTTVWTDSVRSPKKPRINPAIAKFSNPTSAEAILSAMKRDLAAADDAKKDGEEMADYVRKGIEAAYANALAGLGDKRIAASVLEVANGAPKRQRLYLSSAAFRLGEAEGLVVICKELTDGKWPVESTDLYSLAGDLLDLLLTSRLPEADAAIISLAKRQEDLRMIIGLIFNAANTFVDRPRWVDTPIVVELLRSGLADTKQTGRYSTDGGSYNYTPLKDGGWGSMLPDYLKDPALRLAEAPERVCDQAALALSSMVWTLPVVNPLFRDNEQRMDALRKEIGRFKYRAASRAEHIAIMGDSFSQDWRLIPDIPPLTRPATAEDVAAGKAVFTLDGKGKRAALKLPAGAIFKADAKKPEPRRAIIIQAEIAPDGSTKYGVFYRGGVGVMTAGQLSEIKPLAEPKAANKSLQQQE